MKFLFSFVLLSSLVMGSLGFAKIRPFRPNETKETIYKLTSGPVSCLPRITIISTDMIEIPELNYCKYWQDTLHTDAPPEVGGTWAGEGIAIDGHPTLKKCQPGQGGCLARGSLDVMERETLGVSSDGEKLAYEVSVRIYNNSLGAFWGVEPLEVHRKVCIYKYAATKPFPMTDAEMHTSGQCIAKPGRY
jgi:hypothetical protein